MMADEPKDGKLKLYAVNDEQAEACGSYRTIDLISGKIVAEGHLNVAANTATPVADIEDSDHAFYLTEWETNYGKGKNHYACSIGEKWKFEDYVECMKKAGFLDDLEGFEK